jgi:thiamine-monophosphate kinase
MDTSEGLMATLDELMRLNGVGFRIDASWPALLDEEAARIMKASGHPAWFLLAGPHGEFELVFTVAPRMDAILRNLAANLGWQPSKLGAVIEEQVLYLPLDGEERRIDGRHLRRLAAGAANDPLRYLGQLLAIDRNIRKGVIEHEIR